MPPRGRASGYAGQFVAEVTTHFAEPAIFERSGYPTLLVVPTRVELGNNPLVQEVRVEFEVKNGTSEEWQSTRSGLGANWRRAQGLPNPHPDEDEDVAGPFLLTYLFTDEVGLSEGLEEFEDYTFARFRESAAQGAFLA